MCSTSSNFEGTIRPRVEQKSKVVLRGLGFRGLWCRGLEFRGLGVCRACGLCNGLSGTFLSFRAWLAAIAF